MQLTLTTDYAIRSVLYLAQCGRIADAREIAESMQISRTYVIATLSRLREAGLVISRPGKNGGYLLARSPEEIRLYDIVTCIEDTIQFNRCLEKDRYCSRGAVDTCPVRAFYMQVQSEIERLFQEKTIADLLRG